MVRLTGGGFLILVSEDQPRAPPLRRWRDGSGLIPCLADLGIRASPCWGCLEPPGSCGPNRNPEMWVVDAFKYVGRAGDSPATEGRFVALFRGRFGDTQFRKYSRRKTFRRNFSRRGDQAERQLDSDTHRPVQAHGATVPGHEEFEACVGSRPIAGLVAPGKPRLRRHRPRKAAAQRYSSRRCQHLMTVSEKTLSS